MLEVMRQDFVAVVFFCSLPIGRIDDNQLKVDSWFLLFCSHLGNPSARGFCGACTTLWMHCVVF